MVRMPNEVPGAVESASDERDRERVLTRAEDGLSVELIARAVSCTRSFVEMTLDEAPAGRADVPYKYRKIRATANVSGRYRSGESAEDIAHENRRLDHDGVRVVT